MLSEPFFNQAKQNRVVQDLGGFGTFTPQARLLMSAVGLIHSRGWIGAESNLSADTRGASPHLAANSPNRQSCSEQVSDT